VTALALALALAHDDALEPRGWDAARSALFREQVELLRNHVCDRLRGAEFLDARFQTLCATRS
jgi:hypothetical protein